MDHFHICVGIIWKPRFCCNISIIGFRFHRDTISAKLTGMSNSRIGDGTSDNKTQLDIDGMLLQPLLERMPQMAWIRSVDGRTYTNHKLNEFYGNPPSSIDIDDWLSGIHPDDRDLAREKWETFSADPTEYEVLLRVRRSRDNAYRWLTIRVFAIKNEAGEMTHIAGTMNDVSALEQSVRRMEKLQRLADALSGALTQDEVARIVVEKGMLAMSADNGYFLTVSGPENQKSLVYSYDMDRYAITPFAEAAVAKDLPAAHACDTGRPVFVENSAELLSQFPKVKKYARGALLEGFVAIPLRVEKRTVGVICFGFVEKTEFDADFRNFAVALGGQCAQAVERARAFDLERSARARIEAADRAKTSFVASMSHEFRTPLTAILGFNEFLSKESLPTDKRKSYVDGIRRNGQVLLKLVEDILDLSRVETGRIRFDLQPCSPRMIIEDVIDIFRTDVDRKKIVLKTEGLEHLPNGFVTDPVRFRQILINLIGNASKFTDTGEIQIQASMDVQPNLRCLELLIRDTGSGVADEQRDRLFLAFGQAETSGKRKVPGTGLGLFISRGLAQGLGGDIKLEESVLGQGSTFSLRIADLREKLQPTKDSSRDLASSSTAEPLMFNGERVLVVEDTDDLRDFIGAHLADIGFEVEFAKDGQEAIEKAVGALHDIVMMDLHMPVMDGFEAVKRLRAEGYRTPIIAVTARSQPEDRVKCFEVGFDAFLSKPINLRDMEATIRRFLRRRNS